MRGGGGADDRSNIEVKQEFFMDFTLEMNGWIF